MKALQPILDMLERAEHPRQRALEASKPKPVQDSSGAFTMEQYRQMMQRYTQQVTSASADTLTSLLGRGF